jgi:putative transposase
MIRQEAGLSVVWFGVAEISESTWYRWRKRALGAEESSKGPWPSPKRREVEGVVHWLALRHPAWGHRKIWALTIRARTGGQHEHRLSVVPEDVVHPGLLGG